MKYVMFVPSSISLLPILRFMLDEKFQWNASKFAIFYMYKNPKLLFPFFISEYSSLKWKMEKATLGFRIYKIWKILKRFAGTFRWAQTLKLGGVSPG